MPRAERAADGQDDTLAVRGHTPPPRDNVGLVVVGPNCWRAVGESLPLSALAARDRGPGR